MVKVGVGGSWAWIISFVGPLLFLQVFHFSQRGMRGGGVGGKEFTDLGGVSQTGKVCFG